MDSGPPAGVLLLPPFLVGLEGLGLLLLQARLLGLRHFRFGLDLLLLLRDTKTGRVFF